MAIYHLEPIGAVSSTAEPVIYGVPVRDYPLGQLRVAQGGVVGTDTIQVEISTDDGVSWQPAISIGSAPPYAAAIPHGYLEQPSPIGPEQLPYSMLSVAFSRGVVATGDRWRWSTLIGAWFVADRVLRILASYPRPVQSMDPESGRPYLGSLWLSKHKSPQAVACVAGDAQVRPPARRSAMAANPDAQSFVTSLATRSLVVRDLAQTMQWFVWGWRESDTQALANDIVALLLRWPIMGSVEFGAVRWVQKLPNGQVCSLGRMLQMETTIVSPVVQREVWSEIASESEVFAATWGLPVPGFNFEGAVLANTGEAHQGIIQLPST